MATNFGTLPMIAGYGNNSYLHTKHLMERRQFLSRTSIATGSFILAPWLWQSCQTDVSTKIKNWVWITPETGLTENEWKGRFEKLKEHGFHGAIIQVYGSHMALYDTPFLPVQEALLEKLIPIGKASGIEIHAWMWTMPNNNPFYIENHPEFYAVNGLGQPAHTHPAYVGYYRFMCPNQPGVRDFLVNNVKTLAEKQGLDGIHFDYIRLPDVIIAEALQPVYNIVQDREYPEFDYCYCSVCRDKFRNETGIDPLKDLQDPSANLQWRQFRYNSITNLVNKHLIPDAKKNGMKATAAVFPNWESVRQQWSMWDMDAFFPMLYHNFYNADLQWIAENLIKQINSLKNKAPIYSGLFLPALTVTQLQDAIRISIESGAAGVSLFSFHQLNSEHLKIFQGNKPIGMIP
jgi:uncharacterized lipoprotein YddW (UPF0748 family)